MKDVRIGRIYVHNHQKYKVIGLGKMRIHTDTWIDSVSYKPSSQDENSPEVNSCDKTYFVRKFIPSHLELGDVVCASSMGKILAEYEVVEINETSQSATFKKLNKDGKYSDTELVACTSIMPNGSIIIRNYESPLMDINCLEYWLMTSNIQRILQNREDINHGIRILTEISKKFGNVNIAEVDNLCVSRYLKEFQSLKDRIEKDKNICFSNVGI